MRTWEQWQADREHSRRPQLDIEHYEDVGGIKHALSRDAKAALSGMSAEDLKITERMFQALTDTDARGRRIRRPVRVSEIANIVGADRQRVLAIIERFISGGRSFLMLTKEADPLVDISHESLIRQWERMDEWIKAEAESREIYLRIVRATELQAEGIGSVWLGPELLFALSWLRTRSPNRAWAQRYHPEFDAALAFLESSRLALVRLATKVPVVVGHLVLLLMGANLILNHFLPSYPKELMLISIAVQLLLLQKFPRLVFSILASIAPLSSLDKRLRGGLKHIFTPVKVK